MKLLKILLIFFIVLVVVFSCYLFFPGPNPYPGSISETDISLFRPDSYDVVLYGKNIESSLHMLEQSRLFGKILEDESRCNGGSFEDFTSLIAALFSGIASSGSIIGKEFVLFVDFREGGEPNFLLLARPGWKEIFADRAGKRIQLLLGRGSSEAGMEKVQWGNYHLKYIVKGKTLFLSTDEDMLATVFAERSGVKTDKEGFPFREVAENSILMKVLGDSYKIDVKFDFTSMDISVEGSCSPEVLQPWFTENNNFNFSCKEFDGAFLCQGNLNYCKIADLFSVETGYFSDIFSLDKLEAFYLYNIENAGFFPMPDAVMVFSGELSLDNVEEALSRLIFEKTKMRIAFSRENYSYMNFRVCTLLSPFFQLSHAFDGKVSLLSLKRNTLEKTIDSLEDNDNNTKAVITIDGNKLSECFATLLSFDGSSKEPGYCGMDRMVPYLALIDFLSVNIVAKEGDCVLSGSAGIKDLP